MQNPLCLLCLVTCMIWSLVWLLVSSRLFTFCFCFQEWVLEKLLQLQESVVKKQACAFRLSVRIEVASAAISWSLILKIGSDCPSDSSRTFENLNLMNLNSTISDAISLWVMLNEDNTELCTFSGFYTVMTSIMRSLNCIIIVICSVPKTGYIYLRQNILELNIL